MTKQCQCTHYHCTIKIKTKALVWITLLDGRFSTIRLGCSKHTSGEAQMETTTKETL